jgi:integrase
MRKPTLTIRPYPHSKTHRFVLDLRAFGKGRKFFKTRDEAKAERLRVLTTLKKHGREALELSERDISNFVVAKRQLAEYGKTITDAANFLIDHQERIRRCKTTITQLVEELIEAKRKDGRSEIYLRDLKNTLAIFCCDFGNRSVAGVAVVEEIDNWLRNLSGSPKTRMNFRAVVSVLFGYAVKRRMIETNPVQHTEKPKLVDNPPEIFTVNELQALLEAAQRIASDVLPMLALGAFAGLRDAEIKRLDWDEVNLVGGFVDVKAAKAKSARRRVIKIQPNLGAWLRRYREMKGRVVPEGYRSKLDRVRAEAGLTRWPNNGLRHSFASYRLAAIHDAPRVASELGHTSPAMLFNTYREVVQPDDAERYWKIQPAEQTGKVVAFATAN